VKVTYHRSSDTVTVVFTDAPIAESDEDKPGVILDYDASGALVGLEILDASKHVSGVDEIQFKVAG
jgi:uncharacterized protein YuzE